MKRIVKSCYSNKAYEKKVNKPMRFIYMNDKEHLLKFTQQILVLAENVYIELGSGYKEDTYQKALAINFRKHKIKYYKESNIEIFFQGESLSLFRLDFLIPAQKNRRWRLKDPIIIETKAVPSLNDGHRLQIKNYLLSCPKNSSESFKNVRQGFLLNWKAGLDDGSVDNDKEGVQLELYTLRAKKLSTLFSNEDEGSNG